MIGAVVLAAGDSSRMGRPKAALLWRGLPFIEHVCASLRAAGADKRVVVLGRDAEAVQAAWKPGGESIVLNPRPDDGQLSSLRAGIKTLGDVEAFLVCLADQPTIETATYKTVIDRWRAHKDSIIIPRVRRPAALLPDLAKPPAPDEPLYYKRGHPIIIPAAYRGLCFEGPLDKGLHWVTHHPSVKVLNLDVTDPGIIMDFDTPEDYAALGAK